MTFAGSDCHDEMRKLNEVQFNMGSSITLSSLSQSPLSQSCQSALPRAPTDNPGKLFSEGTSNDFIGARWGLVEI